MPTPRLILPCLHFISASHIRQLACLSGMPPVETAGRLDRERAQGSALGARRSGVGASVGLSPGRLVGAEASAAPQPSPENGLSAAIWDKYHGQGPPGVMWPTSGCGETYRRAHHCGERARSCLCDACAMLVPDLLCPSASDSP